MNWTVTLHEVFDDAKPDERPVVRPSFGVEAKNSDEAKARARDWLSGQGMKLRSLAIAVPASSYTLSAIVMVKRTALARGA